MDAFINQLVKLKDKQFGRLDGERYPAPSYSTPLALCCREAEHSLQARHHLRAHDGQSGRWWSVQTARVLLPCWVVTVQCDLRVLSIASISSFVFTFPDILGVRGIDNASILVVAESIFIYGLVREN